MKRLHILTIFAVLTLLLCCLLPTKAEAATSGYFTYTVSNGEATITYCDKSISGDITIPSVLGGYPVTAIGQGAFNSCVNLISVNIPDGITSIGDSAFFHCNSLLTVSIPDSVTSIGKGVFSYCSYLDGIWVSEDNPNFSHDSTGVLFNKNKTSVIQAPGGLSGEYTIPNSVINIFDRAFAFCSRLTNVTIPDSVTCIKDSAFLDCVNLREIIIPDSVTSLGECAFEGCTNLSSVTIGSGLTSIEYYAFGLCHSLQYLNIGENIQYIGDAAFEACESLRHVIIPDSVTAIGDYAFMECTRLSSVVIGRNVTTIGYQAFCCCYALNHVVYAGNQEQFDAVTIDEDNELLTDVSNFHCGVELENVDNCAETGVYCPICQRTIVSSPKFGGVHDFEDITDTNCSVCNYTRKLSDMWIIQLPTKLLYTRFEDALDVDGGQIRLWYNNADSGVIDITQDMVSGFDSAAVGAQTLTVSYGTFTDTYKVEMIPERIEIASLPLKLSYLIGDRLDLTGFVLTAYYEGGKQTAVSATDIQVDLNSTGVKTVMCTFGGLQADFEVYVHEKNVQLVDSCLYPESDHDYGDDIDETKTLKIPGAVSLTLVFDSRSGTEEDWDYVWIQVSEGVWKGLTGDFAGLTVNVTGDTVKIRLTSDESSGEYGYAFEKIEAVMGPLHPEKIVRGQKPTCTEPGLSDGSVCEICGQVIIAQEELPMLGHNYVGGVCTVCGDGSSYTLLLNEDTQIELNLTQDLYVDMNGYDLTGTIITNGFKVYGMDSTTDNYTCDNIGYFTCVDENGNYIVPERIYTEGEKQYMAICTEDRYSFHRFFVGTTHMSLEPEAIGLGYKAAVFGDEMVFAELAETKAFSFKLQLEGYTPVYRHFDSDELASGDPITLRIRNYDVENYSEHNLYAQVSLTLNDGTVIEAEQVALTFRWLTEQVNENYTDYTADQLASFKAMLQQFDIVKKWNIPNLI